MTTGQKRRVLTTDDLLRRQEERAQKKSRVSPPFEFDGVDDSETSSELSGETSEEEVAKNEVRPGERNNSGNASNGDDDDVLLAGEDEEPLTSGESETGFPVTVDWKRRTGFQSVKTKHMSRRPFEPTPATFASLGISAPLQASLSVMSIWTPTEVQAACIPPLLAGRDCIGNAKTGSGKTIAFALPILQQLSMDPYGIYALVLTPTRELAFQISEQFAVLGSSLNVRTAVVVGGMDMMAQALELKDRPHVVIATPGRMVDHLRSSSGEWDLSRVKFLVLDEADRLLTPTFAPDLSHLFGVLPKDRQTSLFTATLTESIEALASAPPRPGKQHLFIHRMSAKIETVSTLKQHYILVPSHVRELYLYYLLCHPPESTIPMRRAPPEPTKLPRKSTVKAKSKQKAKAAADDDNPEQPPPTIIFCARARTAAYLTKVLHSLSIRSTELHSGITQRERLSSLSLFRAAVVPVLVSTDVGARGLDIEDVAMVINWDIPKEPEEYVHRVGRTARAGRGGFAISFVTERDEERVLKIENKIGTKLEEMMMAEEKVLEKLSRVSTAKRVATDRKSVV